MTQTQLNIGMFGFGVVGKGLHEVLQQTPGIRCRIKTICIKNPDKSRSATSARISTNPDDILNDPEIDIVVELTDDAEAAFGYVSRALSQKKAVVTANKKMVSEQFQTLLHLQEIHQTPLLYEASVCASIPIIRNLEEYYDNDLLNRICGIVNGSTNYILSKTFDENLSCDAALKQAQELGYAESDPSLDTSGADALSKLQILLAHAFGVVGENKAVQAWGIDRLGDLEIQYAREKGARIKLLAWANLNADQTVSAFVAPWLLKPGNQLYDVGDVYNGISLQTAFAENQFFSGRGAGAFPTASAVLSDISALTCQYRYGYKKIRQQMNIQINNHFQVSVLLKFSAPQPESLKNHFTSIDEIHLRGNQGYILGSIWFDTLCKLRDQGISVVIDRILN